MTYDNRHKGALFKNKDKAIDEEPDYRGSLDVGGEAFWISAWLRTSRKGERYMSLAVQPKAVDSLRRMPEEDEGPF